MEKGEAVVIMTHHFLQDIAILRAVLPSSAGYIGLLGPVRRKELLLRELRRDPCGDDPATAPDGSTGNAEPIRWLEAASLRRLHGPAGLDIGAETPEQIALSILAEIEAYSARRRGGPLRRRRQPLHDKIPETRRNSVAGHPREAANERQLAASSFS